jgi:hypothetical protein
VLLGEAMTQQALGPDWKKPVAKKNSGIPFDRRDFGITFKDSFTVLKLSASNQSYSVNHVYEDGAGRRY